MENGKKLIVFSILAIAIGIAAIAPLGFFMSTAKAQTDDAIPWFNVYVPYASWEAYSKTNATGYLEGIGTIYDLVSYSSTHYVALNYTVNPDAVDRLDDARIEYYQLQVYSDKGQIEKLTIYFGANCKDDGDPTASFNFAREDWFNTTTSAGGTFISKFNGTLENTLADGGLLGMGGSSGGGSFANATLPKEFLNAQDANKVFIDVRRLGYVTFVGNSTIVTLASNEVIQHMELTKTGNKFVYSTLSESQLAEIPKIPQSPVFPEQKP